jgi:hypothetical protein
MTPVCCTSIAPVPPHLRSPLARAGGQENDLMRLAGWRTREMIGR